MVTPTEVAAVLGVHRHTILRRIAAGSIPASRISRRKVLIPLDWLRSFTGQEAPPANAG